MINTLRKTLLLFLFSFIVFNSINAQSLRAYINAADQAFATNDYFTALVYYKKVLEVEPDRNDIHFKYAESARLFQAYRIAEDAYHKITLSKDSMRFPLATFWLGAVKKNLAKYDEAEVAFNDYLEKYKRVNPRYSRRAEKNIIDCRWAKRMMRSQNKNLTVEHIKDGINTPYSEFGAVEVDSSVYFSSMRFKDKTEMFYSKLMKRKKDGIIEVLEFNTDDKFAANPSISFDGNRLYYTLCKYNVVGEINCEIVYRDRKYNDVWGEAQELPAFINFPGFTATHPTIGFDKINNREVLFFSSNRPGGKGKLDIWYSTVAPNGKFTRPVNHSIINSRENDVTPFFHSPSQVLYFSSDGYPGMGGYDIYKVKRIGRSWQTPIHLVYPVNSSYNDFYFSLNDEGKKSYFASNRIEAMEIDEENEACCNDLFVANVQPEKVELTKEEFLALTKDNGSNYLVEELDEPKVIILSEPEPEGEAKTGLDIESEKVTTTEIATETELETKPEKVTNTITETTTNPAIGLDIPETILGESKPDESSTIVANDPKNDSSNSEQLNTKGESQEVIVKEEPKINTSPSIENLDANLSRDVFSLVFEVEVLDMNLEPLSDVNVEFEEHSKESNSRNFSKQIKSGNKVKFRIKNHVDYSVILSKSGFETDTFTLDRENLLDATELTLPFFMNEISDRTDVVESPLKDQLEEELVTQEMLNEYIPLALYFNNNEPDPTSWSFSTNLNYEQTFLSYYSKQERFKDRYVRKFAPSQREDALIQVEGFFENDLKKNYEVLMEFSDQLAKYLEKGNKITIGFQGLLVVHPTNFKSTALVERRISSLRNHFRTHLGGKLISYINEGLLKFEILDPIIVKSSDTPNELYSPEASKLRKVDIKIFFE
ncbi:MAG: tetratricopeptide repeat protein [Saprospiraceae bacterium]